MRNISKLVVISSLLALTACGAKGNSQSTSSSEPSTTASSETSQPVVIDPVVDEDAPADSAPEVVAIGEVSEEVALVAPVEAPVEEVAAEETPAEGIPAPAEAEASAPSEEVVAAPAEEESKDERTKEERKEHKKLAKLPLGKFVTETCFLNGGASEGFGRKIYTRAALKFGKKGKGYNSFILYEDEDCTREAMRARLNIRYHASAISKQAMVIAVKQYNEGWEEKTASVYYLLAQVSKNKLILDVDAANGGHSPYFEKPSLKEVRAALEDLEKRGVVLKRGGHLPKSEEQLKKEEEKRAERENEEKKEDSGKGKINRLVQANESTQQVLLLLR